MGYELAAALAVVAIIAYVVAFRRRRASAVPPPPPRAQEQKQRVTTGDVRVVRPNPGTVEGLEIRYGVDGLVRSVRVGAMNSEHKELLLTMDGQQWSRLPNSQKQEVVMAARSTWAAKMCGYGPDIAYLVVATESGDIVARADPHSVRVL